MKINVLVLKIHRLDKEFPSFDALTALKKIDRISERIKKLYAEINRADSDNPVLVIWREYGITEGENPLLDGLTKKKFKEAMQQLTADHPRLAILAGSILSKKNYPDNLLLPRLRSIYQETAWAGKLEIVSNDNKLWNDAFEKVNKNQQPLPLSKIDVARNTAYLFQSEMPIQKHDKIFPFRSDTQLKEYSLFQPAKGNNLSCLFRIQNSFDQEAFFAGVEICRDHCFGTLQREVLVKQLDSPLIQIILGDSVWIFNQYICSEFSILVDSYEDTRLLVSSGYKRSGQAQYDVILSENNLLENSEALEKIEPVFYHPLAKMMSNDEQMKYINLLEKEVPSTTLDYQYYFALRNAIPAGNYAALQQIMNYSAIEKVLSFKNVAGDSLLQIADRYQDMKILQLLLSRIRQKPLIDEALYLACKNRLIMQIKEFLDMQTDPNEAFSSYFFNKKSPDLPLKKTCFSSVEKTILNMFLESEKLEKEKIISLIFQRIRVQDAATLDLIRNSGRITNVPDLAPVFRRERRSAFFPCEETESFSPRPDYIL